MILFTVHKNYRFAKPRFILHSFTKLESRQPLTRFKKIKDTFFLRFAIAKSEKIYYNIKKTTKKARCAFAPGKKGEIFCLTDRYTYETINSRYVSRFAFCSVRLRLLGG